MQTRLPEGQRRKPGLSWKWGGLPSGELSFSVHEMRKERGLSSRGIRRNFDS